MKLPGYITSYHICIYLPTAGKDDQFISELSSLEVLLTDIYKKHDGKCPIFIRGDGNASSKNVLRSNLLKHFLLKHNLFRVKIPHHTYHHFVGNGLFDSDLDIILYSDTPGTSEVLENVICKLDNPLINSLHDIVITTFTLPPDPAPPPPSMENIKAPRIENTRQKVLWSLYGICHYQEALGGKLSELRDSLGLSSSSPSSMALLLSSTYSLLSSAAAETNKVIKLGQTCPPKQTCSPKIIALQLHLFCAHKTSCSVSSSPSSSIAAIEAAAAALSSARSDLKHVERSVQRQQSLVRDVSGNCKDIFKSIRSSKSAGSKITLLVVKYM